MGSRGAECSSVIRMSNKKNVFEFQIITVVEGVNGPLPSRPAVPHPRCLSAAAAAGTGGRRCRRRRSSPARGAAFASQWSLPGPAVPVAVRCALSWRSRSNDDHSALRTVRSSKRADTQMTVHTTMDRQIKKKWPRLLCELTDVWRNQ